MFILYSFSLFSTKHFQALIIIPIRSCTWLHKYTMWSFSFYVLFINDSQIKIRTLLNFSNSKVLVFLVFENYTHNVLYDWHIIQNGDHYMLEKYTISNEFCKQDLARSENMKSDDSCCNIIAILSLSCFPLNLPQVSFPIKFCHHLFKVIICWHLPSVCS